MRTMGIRPSSLTSDKNSKESNQASARKNLAGILATTAFFTSARVCSNFVWAADSFNLLPKMDRPSNRALNLSQRSAMMGFLEKRNAASNTRQPELFTQTNWVVSKPAVLLPVV